MFLPSKRLFKTILLILSILLCLLVGKGVFGATLFEDDFETYNLGILGSQGDWVAQYGGEGEYQVSSEKTFSGEKAMKCQPTAEGVIWRDAPELPAGQITFYGYIDEAVEGFAVILQYRTTEDLIRAQSWYVACSSGICSLKYDDPYLGTITYAGVSIQEWHAFTIEWDDILSKMRIKMDNLEWSDWTWAEPYHILRGVYQLQFGGRRTFIDYIAENPLVPVMEIKGQAPDSGTVITNLNTSLTIQYKNFNWNIYDGFIVNFRDNKIWAVANSVQFLEADLDPSGTGSEIINLQDFGIDSNGIWYLTGLGFGTHLDIEGGMFLTTRGYIDFWTDELVKTPYYLIFNVEGLPTPYTFTEPENWYSVNVERFDTPTTLFISFVGLISPIFEKISEFGLRTQIMFDKNQAYDRGFSLGEIFPLIKGYSQKIDSFFGGFPLTSFFTYSILVMLAIFIIRTVLKFIPLLGGGG